MSLVIVILANIYFPIHYSQIACHVKQVKLSFDQTSLMRKMIQHLAQNADDMLILICIEIRVAVSPVFD